MTSLLTFGVLVHGRGACNVHVFHPICEHRPICRRAVGRWDGPIWLHLAQSADEMSAAGMSHLPTFCPICHLFVQFADGLSADGTVPSGYILPNLQTGRQQMARLIFQHFAPSADMPSLLPTGQNVGRCAVPSADEPIWLHFAQSADGTSAYGTSHLPTFLPNLLTFNPNCRWAVGR